MSNETNVTPLFQKDRDITDFLNSLIVGNSDGEGGDELLKAWDESCKEQTGKGLIRFAALDRRFPETGKVGSLELGSDAPRLIDPDALPDHLFMEMYRKQQEAETNGADKPSLFVVKEQIKTRLIKLAADQGVKIYFDHRHEDGGRIEFAYVSFMEHWTSEKDRRDAEYRRKRARQKKGDNGAASSMQQVREADQAPTL